MFSLRASRAFPRCLKRSCSGASNHPQSRTASGICAALFEDLHARAAPFSAGVLEKDGTMGNAYYDDDDAFEFMLDEIGKKRKSNDRELDMIASFIDQYMDLQQAYLEDKGLMSWD